MVEDTDYTIQDLIEMGFSQAVTDALALLTHDKSVSYSDYVSAIKNNLVARAVKIADLKHNSDLSRLDSVNDDDMARIEKYRRSLNILLEPEKLDDK